MSYISSNNNRWYCQIESGYGLVPSIASHNRIPAVQMSVRQTLETAQRNDKTGTRTFFGAPATGRRKTAFELKTYMTGWNSANGGPSHGPLVQAALGGTPLSFAGGTAAGSSTTLTVAFAAPHGLEAGQALTYQGEIRFVASVIDASTVLLNAALSSVPTAGSAVGPTITFMPTSELPSVSILDYWSPSTAVQRVLCGGSINRMEVDLNGDYHGFTFQGLAQDVVDSGSFSAGMGALSTYPAEPVIDPTPLSVIPGHLGQVWLGAIATRFFTITSGKVVLNNEIDQRTREFGSILPRAISPGSRSVALDFELFGQDDTATAELYQAARQRSQISVSMQLGQQNGQLMGMYMRSVTPEVPDFNDKERRMQWQFKGSLAQGQGDDEIAVAFG